MTLSLRTVIFVAALGLPIAGCTDGAKTVFQSPVSPTPNSGVITVLGYISDTAFRLGEGAVIEAIDGPDAGKSTTVGPTGEFILSGRFTASTLFRATWEGHVSVTQTIYPCISCGGNYLYFNQMAVSAPPVQIAGDYTMTLVADAGCTSIPEDLRTRTYHATVARYGLTSNPGTLFSGTMTDHAFLASSNTFVLGVAGDVVGFSIEGETGPIVVEDLGGNRYLGFNGRADAAVGSAMTTVSTPFRGEIAYCALKTKMGNYWNCDTRLAVAHGECTSSNHRLIVSAP